MSAIVPAATSAPTDFDAHLASWILEERKESVFFIQQIPRVPQINEIEDLMKQVNTLPAGKQRSDRIKYARLSTGFVIAVRDDCIYLLTTSHILDHITKGSAPISVGKANSLLATTVLCQHYEVDYRQGGSSAERAYAKAKIVDINCNHDLMLIKVKQLDLVGYDQRVCNRRHAAIMLGLDDSIRMSRCVMISWPPYKPCMVAEGHGSDNLRLFSEISKTNRMEYTMPLLEVNITSEDGCSGAPLLNGAGKVIGLLHGGFGSGYSYFVPLNCIRDFLARNQLT